ncbi:hypothetical protein [Nocardia farcinica]|uniref:hypothetical protein n=1 Tax=Nocardia farcinica TaxID=37329 RepID=UPI003797F436
MTGPGSPTRAVALLHGTHDPATLEALTRKHRLHLVYTVHADVTAVLAALIAVQHVLDRAADAVVIPHLDDLEAGTPWRVVTRVADLITATQRYPRRWGITASTPPEQ